MYLFLFFRIYNKSYSLFLTVIVKGKKLTVKLIVKECDVN
jgi:hypothetical protein